MNHEIKAGKLESVIARLRNHANATRDMAEQIFNASGSRPHDNKLLDRVDAMHATRMSVALCDMQFVLYALEDRLAEESKPRRYMVSVSGGSAPSNIHPTLEMAKAEAARLSQKPHCRNSTIHALEIKATLKPVAAFEWVQDAIK